MKENIFSALFCKRKTKKENDFLRNEFISFIKIYYDELYFNKTIITDIKAEEKTKEYILHITTHRPGILIGKQGRDIERLNSYLNKNFNKPVRIIIIENTLWY